MKLSVLLLTLALATIAMAGIMPRVFKTPNPNDIFRKVQFRPLNALDYADPWVQVDLVYINTGYHGSALRKVRVLYPHYSLLPVLRCRYSNLGLVRFYTFSFKVEGEVSEIKTAVEVEESSSEDDASSDDEKDGYMRISVEWAQQDPRISVAVNHVIKSNYAVIEGRPLIACWSKPVAGLYSYRLYFKNVNGRFEYRESSAVEKVEGEHRNYFAEASPILDVANSDDPKQYTDYLVKELMDHPVFPQMRKLFEEEFGFFDDNWIVKYAGVGSKTSDTLKVVINFKPFLLQQHYEAFYYGDIEKASLLKVDEKVFNQGASYEKWQEIEHFDKFNAFHEAHEFVLYHFTWLRHYEVQTAYAALHKKGRFIRLVYKGIEEQNIDDENQINIVVYVDEKGQYFIDRNDFHATHLNSFGRNDWVSLFVETPDVTKAAYYQRIVKFYKAIYPKVWSVDQLVDVKFKDDLHIIKFKNPINQRYNVLMVNDKETKVLNKVNWIKLDDDSPLIVRIEKLVRGKHADCGKIMFVQYFKDEKGTHFEISYLTTDNKYKAVYLTYIADTDVFTDNKSYRFKAVTFGKHPLPANIKDSILAFLQSNDHELLAVSSFVELSPESFAIIGVSNTGRWQIIVEWQDGKWVAVSKQPYSDGYYKAKGYPSAIAASGTGFLKRLYPKQFGQGYVYASIETKNVGVSIFIRMIFKFKGGWIEAVVKKIYGVNNSHVLYSWRVVNGIKDKKDYGYGFDYSYSYNLDNVLLYKSDDKPMKNLSQEEVPAEPVAETQPIPAHTNSPCPLGSRRQMYTYSCVVVF